MSNGARYEVIEVFADAPDAFETLSAGIGRFEAFKCFEVIAGDLGSSMALQLAELRFNLAIVRHTGRKKLRRMFRELNQK